MESKDRETGHSKKRGRMREFFAFGELFGYFFRSRRSDRPTNINIRMMHGINKIAIVVFLLGIIYLILKRLL
jgi:hypothetical protein